MGAMAAITWTTYCAVVALLARKTGDARLWAACAAALTVCTVLLFELLSANS